MISATRAAVEPRITSSGFIIRIGCFSIKFRPSSDKVVILTMTCWLRLKPPKSVVLSSTHGTHPLTHGRYGISPSNPSVEATLRLGKYYQPWGPKAVPEPASESRAAPRRWSLERQSSSMGISPSNGERFSHQHLFWGCKHQTYMIIRNPLLGICQHIMIWYDMMIKHLPAGFSSTNHAPRESGGTRGY